MKINNPIRIIEGIVLNNIILDGFFIFCL